MITGVRESWKLGACCTARRQLNRLQGVLPCSGLSHFQAQYVFLSPRVSMPRGFLWWAVGTPGEFQPEGRNGLVCTLFVETPSQQVALAVLVLTM